MNHDKGGFSLVEIMVVIVVMSILYLVVLPSFNSSLLKARRSEGQSLLFQVQSQMERYRYDKNTYPEKLSEMRPYDQDKVLSDGGYFEVSIMNASGSCHISWCYQLEAKPTAKKRQHELLELHSDGTRVGQW
jgi:type IV pilus assembly protein PilE